MQFRRLSLPGLIEIVPVRHQDKRGYFSETFKQAIFSENGCVEDFVQENQSLSHVAGTVRGLHFQTAPFVQAKLVRCVTGSVFDVAVDLRIGSPCFGKWEAVTLSAEAGNQLYLPGGFAHGFCTLEPETTISYKVSAYYDPGSDFGLQWNDPAIGIIWPSAASAETLSDKDRAQPSLAQLPAHFTFED